jgi:hypothetical protein
MTEGTEFTGHVRAMRADAEFFGAEDIDGLGDVWFQIVCCKRFENRKACGKPVKEMFTLFLKDKTGRECSKEFWIKPTNRQTIRKLYGANVADWKGKWLCFYSTEVKSPSGGMTLGIRIREKTDGPKKTEGGAA